MENKIFNIFGKKRKEKAIEKNKEKIIIDYREKNCLVPATLVRMGFEIELKELKTGDYLVRDVLIERKTISDFLSSMINKRMVNQMEEMKSYENKLLIIEGFEENNLYSDSYKNGGINSNAIRGFLLSILLKHKIPLLFSKNPEDTAKIIAVLAKRKEKEISIKERKKGKNVKEQKQIIIEGFPGIGPKNAKKLLKEFKSIKGVVNASEEEINKIIGKKSKTIKKVIEEDY